MAKRKSIWWSVAASLLVAVARCHGAWAQVAPPWSQPAVSLGAAADRFVLRLTPDASRAAFRPPTSGAVARARLGLPALDRLLAAWPGTWLEPEFRGDRPPAPGSPETDFSAFYVVHLPPGVAREPALERCRALAEVADAHPIGLAPVTVVPNDSLWSLAYYFYQPSRRDIHAPEAWDLTRGDTSVVVAIIDTGVVPYHPDLGGTVAGSSGQLWTNPKEAAGQAGVDEDGNGFLDDVHGWDFVSLINDVDAVPGEDWQDADNDPNDYVGHGTCVAGLLGAIDDNAIGVSGTAWNVRLMPLRVGWSSPRQPAGIVDMAYIAQAVRYATRMRASVINISLSNTSVSELDLVVRAALDSNIVVVVAAGNNGTPNYIGESIPDATVVAATDANDVVPIWSNRNGHVDLAAPGVNLATTILSRPGTDSLGLRTPSYVPDVAGTSFSAPLVSGAAALMAAARRARGLELLSPRQVGKVLQFTADDIAAQNPGITGYGAGRLDMAPAILAASRIRARRLGKLVVACGIAFRTNRGDSLLALPTEDGQLTFLDATTLDPRGGAPLGGVPTRALAAADLGRERGLGIFASLGDRIVGLGAAGAPLPGWPVAVPSGGLVGMPALGDLDGDGSLEVVCAGTGGRLWAWTSAGGLYPGFPLELGAEADVYAPLALSDLDGEPGVEIIAARTDGRVHALRWNGQELPGWPVSTADPLPAGPVVGARSGQPLVVVAGSRAVHWIGPAGSQLPETPRSVEEICADPALGDLDHDGSDDAVVAGASGARAFVLGGGLLPGWPVLWGAALVGPPLIGYFASSDTQAVVIGVDSSVRGITGAGGSLPAFLPYPGADPYAVMAIGSGDEATLLQGTVPDGTLYGYDFPAAAGAGGSHAWTTPRGGPARTGSRLYQPAIGEGDVIPPGAVLDLRAAAAADSTANLLSWTAPADAGPAGKAIEYDVRTAPLAADLQTSFTTAKRLAAAIAPAAAGQPDSLLVTGLSPADRWFAVRSRDASGNWSAPSAPVARLFPAPAPPPGPGPAPEGELALTLGRNPSSLPLAITWQVPRSSRERWLRIFDLGGRMLRRIALDSPLTQGTLYWDGRGPSGSAAPSGVYLVTLDAGSSRITARFVLLR